VLRISIPAAPRGVATLAAVTIAAVLLVIVVAILVRGSHQAALRRDVKRGVALENLARAQAYYFDRTSRYGSQADLVSLKLLTAPLLDPAMQVAYELYLNSNRDEWCAWARLEAGPKPYLRQDEKAATTSAKLPTNLATCKD